MSDNIDNKIFHLIQKIVIKTSMDKIVVQNIIDLLDQGNTVPFIARYRKELTKGATDEQLRDFNDIYIYTKNLEARKEDIIRLINEKGLLTPKLQEEILNAETLAKVEDIYRPYKEKKNTKATIAKYRGLQPLADLLKKCTTSKEDFEEKAKIFSQEVLSKWENLKGDERKNADESMERFFVSQKLSLDSQESKVNGITKFCIQGAKDIVAEDVSDSAQLREKIKSYEEINCILETKPTKTFDDNGVYKIYKSYSKKLSEIPSYAFLAITRAEKEKQLNVNLNISREKSINTTEEFFVPFKYGSSYIYLYEALQDGLKRLLLPSINREIISDKKRRADESAIKVFGDNLKHLLLTPPVKGMTILGFDPAFRTGCKIAIVDKTGKFLYNTVIYPTEPQNKIKESELTILELIKKYNINLIVIGNGTASRESEKFISSIIKNNKLKVQYMIVSEAGASVYSASKLAQEEYPSLDVTVRGAISIAHRVQDPLAEFTKIDPKAIGVGQYQHDVDQRLLKQKLDEKVEDVVNSVGVDVNTASYTLLQHIAGLTQKVAKSVIEYRDLNGEFIDKASIKKSKGLGPKAYEQAIGFLRIKGGKNSLDATGIHPEIYKNVYNFIETELLIKKNKLKLPITIEKFSDLQIQDFSNKYGIGFETIKDVLQELQNPGLDPRENIQAPIFKSDVMEIKDLQKGMILDGTIRNVTDFGAFVDIGLHSDGLVHKSQIAPFFVNNPIDIVSVGMQVKVKVLEIDPQNEKVSLSMKECENNITSKIQNKKTNETHNNSNNNSNNETEESSLRGNIIFS